MKKNIINFKLKLIFFFKKLFLKFKFLIDNKFNTKKIIKKQNTNNLVINTLKKIE